MISKLKKIYSNLDIHTAEVVRKSAASTVVKVVGTVIGFGVSIFLGRTLGADGLGIINLSIRFVQILMIVGLLGMPQVILKEISIAHSHKKWQHIGDVMHTSYLLNGGVSIAVSLLVILAAPWLSEHVFQEPRLTWPLIIAVMVMPAQVFSRIFSAGLIGFRKIWQSNLVDQTLSVSITGLVLLGMFLMNLDITVNSVALAYAFGRLGVTISVGIYWRTLFSYKDKRKFIGKKLRKAAIHLFVVSAAGILFKSLDLIILGYFENSTQIGLYSVAKRVSLFTIFFLQISNSAIAPKIASLYKNGKIKEIELMIRKVTFGLSLIGISFFLLFLLFGKSILSVWGIEFIESYSILLILALGQLVNVGTGAVGIILIMTGNERVQQNISLAFIIIYIILNIILIKFYGILGAAISFSLTIAGINIAKIIYVNMKTGIKIRFFK